MAEDPVVSYTPLVEQVVDSTIAKLNHIAEMEADDEFAYCRAVGELLAALEQLGAGRIEDAYGPIAERFWGPKKINKKSRRWRTFFFYAGR